MERKIAVLKKCDNEENIFFVFNEPLQINKKNSEIIEVFLKLAKIYNEKNNKKESYKFSIIEDEIKQSVDYYNSIIEGKREKFVNEGNINQFIYTYIAEYFEEYNKSLIGIDPIEKAKKIISCEEQKNKLKRH